MQGAAQALGPAEHFQAKTRQLPVAVFGQQGLHVGYPVKQLFSAHFLPIILPLFQTKKSMELQGFHATTRSSGMTRIADRFAD
jgi:hypothetical protein